MIKGFYDGQDNYFSINPVYPVIIINHVQTINQNTIKGLNDIQDYLEYGEYDLLILQKIKSRIILNWNKFIKEIK